jgi:hypothetical protein
VLHHALLSGWNFRIAVRSAFYNALVELDNPARKGGRQRYDGMRIVLDEIDEFIGVDDLNGAGTGCDHRGDPR